MAAQDLTTNSRITILDGQGQYYSEKAFENTLLPFAYSVLAYVNVEGKIELSYDHTHDFYHAKFTAGGKAFDVRMYKVWSVSVDGKDGWCGCPSYNEMAFIAYLRDVASGAKVIK